MIAIAQPRRATGDRSNSSSCRAAPRTGCSRAALPAKDYSSLYYFCAGLAQRRAKRPLHLRRDFLIAPQRGPTARWSGARWRRLEGKPAPPPRNHRLLVSGVPGRYSSSRRVCGHCDFVAICRILIAEIVARRGKNGSLTALTTLARQDHKKVDQSPVPIVTDCTTPVASQLRPQFFVTAGRHGKQFAVDRLRIDLAIPPLKITRSSH